VESMARARRTAARPEMALVRNAGLLRRKSSSN
jgi:hypothetical protein